MQARSTYRLMAIAFLIVVIMIAGAHWYSSPRKPDTFYNAQANGPTGTMIAAEPVVLDLEGKGQAFRLLYNTSRPDGRLASASALLLLPVDMKTSPLPVIAWAHGTTGIVSGCAPSVMSKPLANVPAVAEALSSGWAILMPDYIGLGTPSGHAYLVGPDAALSMWDALRAARSVEAYRLGSDVVVWGHSQGGGTALWTGLLWKKEASDFNLRGVAAFAPASDLTALALASQKSPFGKIVSSYIINAYTRVYPDVVMSDYVSLWSRIVAADIASRCVGELGTLFSVAETFLLPSGGIFRQSPDKGALAQRLKENSPFQAQPVPLMVAQGLNDDLVLPQIQNSYVDHMCGLPGALSYMRFQGLDHISLVHIDSPLVAKLMAWTGERFANQPIEQKCVRSDF